MAKRTAVWVEITNSSTLMLLIQKASSTMRIISMRQMKMTETSKVHFRQVLSKWIMETMNKMHKAMPPRRQIHSLKLASGTGSSRLRFYVGR